MPSLMEDVELEALRDRLNYFIQRRGHGAIGEVAERAGIGRDWLSKFRNGAVRIERKSALAIRAALDDLDELNVAREQPAAYNEAQELLGLLGDDFLAVGNRLKSRAESPIEKVRNLEEWTVKLHRELRKVLDKIGQPAQHAD